MNSSNGRICGHFLLFYILPCHPFALFSLWHSLGIPTLLLLSSDFSYHHLLPFCGGRLAPAGLSFTKNQMFLALAGLNLILAPLTFSWSFSKRHLVYGAVIVVRVILSILALMGGRRTPQISLSPPTTHLDALMMTSITMVNANGEMHPAIMPYLHTVQSSGKVRQGET